MDFFTYYFIRKVKKSMLDELTLSYKDHQFYLTKRQVQLVNKTKNKFAIARSNR